MRKRCQKAAYRYGSRTLNRTVGLIAHGNYERPGAGMDGATRVAECVDEGVAMALFCEEEAAYCV